MTSQMWNDNPWQHKEARIASRHLQVALPYCALPADEGGAWLPCITTNRNFYGVSFSGDGYIDELRMSESNLGPIAPVQANFGQAVAIFWPSDYGQSYQVETCVDLADDAWEAFGDPVIRNGATNTVFEKTGSSTRKFYRVIPLR